MIQSTRLQALLVLHEEKKPHTLPCAWVRGLATLWYGGGWMLKDFFDRVGPPILQGLVAFSCLVARVRFCYCMRTWAVAMRWVHSIAFPPATPHTSCTHTSCMGCCCHAARVPPSFCCSAAAPTGVARRGLKGCVFQHHMSLHPRLTATTQHARPHDRQHIYTQLRRYPARPQGHTRPSHANACLKNNGETTPDGWMRDDNRGTR